LTAVIALLGLTDGFWNLQVVDMIVSSAGPMHMVDETIAADSSNAGLTNRIVIAPRAGQLAREPCDRIGSWHTVAGVICLFIMFC
jgi:hypothetical protein